MKDYLEKLKTYWICSVRIMKLSFRANCWGNVFKTIGAVVTAITPLGYSYLLKLIIDKIVFVSQHGQIADLASFWPLMLGFFGLEALNRFGWRVITYYDQIIHLDLNHLLSIKTTNKLSRLNFEQWENPRLNDLVNKVRETYTYRPANFASRQIWLIQNIVSVISNIIAVVTLGPVYVLVILVATIPEFFIGIRYGRSAYNIHGAKGELRRDFYNTSHILTYDKNLPEVHIFGIQRKLVNRIDRLYKKFFDYQKEEIKKLLISQIFITAASFGIYILVIGIIIARAITGAITVGSLSFYMGRVEGLGRSFKNMFKNLSNNFEDLLYVQDLFTIYDLEPTIEPNPKGKVVEPPFKIEFKNVWFGYPSGDKPVLKDFNLTIEPKENIALIGENGAGKTTIIKLLIRFYDVDKGQILINGVDIRDLNLKSWRKQIGALFQDFNRYPYTFLENIRLGDVDKKPEKDLVNEVIKKAEAKGLVEKLPKKKKTILSKRFKGGVDLSTGEWQKVGLARAFFRDAPILILDEPTSSIDAETEYKIFKQIHEFEKDKTVVMISHRFSTVKDADKIYIIENGKISESGSHQELMEKEGKYTKLFKLQADSYNL